MPDADRIRQTAVSPLCVIPARGGSRRLPRKNVLELAGRPMLGWMVEAAVRSGIFTEVVVSTEDHEIAGIAAGLGAAVHQRPLGLADDLASSTDVCLDVADAIAGDHEALVCLQPTSPLTEADDVRAAWTTFEAERASFLVSVTPIDPHYFHWAVENRAGTWRPYFGDEYMRDRLELPAVFRPNGAIKIARVGELRARGNFFGQPLAVHSMPEERSVHVAHEIDAQLAGLLLANRHQERG